MAQTFLQKIKALTSFDITSSSNPSEADLTTFILDGVKCVTNAIIAVNPDESLKFAVETEDTNDSGVILTGNLLSVVREHDSTSTLRPCELIDASHRYEATNTDSLHYRSKYNPGYYILNRKVHVVPASATSNNSALVSQVTYSTTEDNPSTGTALDYSSEDIQFFPDEYEHLVTMYATALTCGALAADVHNDLPTLASMDYSALMVSLPTLTAPTLAAKFDMPVVSIPPLDIPSFPTQPTITVPSFEVPTVIQPEFNMPSFPDFGIPAADFDLTNVRTQLTAEDLDLVDKEFDVVQKTFDKFDKDMEVSKELHTRGKEEFDKEFEKAKSEFDGSLEISKENFNKQFQENAEVFVRTFEKSKEEFTADWEQLKITYGAEHQNEIQVFEKEFQKNIEIFGREFERQAMRYKTAWEQEVQSFQASVQIELKNAEMDFTVETQKMQTNIAKYERDVAKFTQQYNWWMGQYQAYMAQYVNNIQMLGKPRPQEPQEQDKRRR